MLFIILAICLVVGIFVTEDTETKAVTKEAAIICDSLDCERRFVTKAVIFVLLDRLRVKAVRV